MLATWSFALIALVIISISILGWTFLTRNLAYLSSRSVSEKLPLPFFLALGLGFFAFLVTFFGIFIGYTIHVQGTLVIAGWIFVILFRGQTFEIFEAFRDEVKIFLSGGKRQWLWISLPKLYFLTRIFSAGLPQQHNDALYYHLAAPKFWAETGKIAISKVNPSFSQATLWESVYGLQQLFFGTKGDANHVLAQVYAQLMHVYWGQVLFILICISLLRHFIPTIKYKVGFGFFLAWIVSTLPCVEWTGGLAKNDYIVSVFATAAFLPFLYAERIKSTTIALSAILAGLAFVSKMSAAPTVLAVYVYCFSKKEFRQKFIRYSLVFAMAFIFPGLPVYLHKTIETMNPFFPAFDKMIVAKWWSDHNASFIGLPKPDLAMFGWIYSKLLEKSLSKVLSMFAIAGLCIGIFERSSKRKIDWFFIFAVLLQLAVLVLMLRPGADGRYGGYALTMFFVSGFAILINFVESKISESRWYFFLLLPLGLMINSPVDLLVKIPKKYWFHAPWNYVYEFHAYQEAKNWMNLNLKNKPDNTVVAIADKANFYLDVPFVTFTEMRSFEKLTEESPNAEAFLANIKKAGYRYIFIQTHFVYPPTMGRFWDELMLKSKALTVFAAQSVLILDLAKIPSSK